jgi:dihydrofolate reductase
MINAIFAMDLKGGIGKDGTLPWPHNPKDFRWFRSHTTNNTVVMGRKTWDDPKMPKPLPNRKNVVFTSRAIEFHENVTPVSITHAKSWLQKNSNKELFIIGGAKVLSEYWDMIDRFYVTEFNSVYDCDTYISNDNLEKMQNKKLTYFYDYGEITFKVWG